MKKLYIAILYHQHQPMYKDPIKNHYYLPWVRLHTIKDYYDMAVWVEKFSNLKLNFNFVPSLLVQIEDYANGALDKHLELTLKPVLQLTDEDKVYILKEFFNCNWDNMLFPYKRYKELLDLRGHHNLSYEELYRKIKYFNKNDWLDLKMWSNLVWFDPYWRNIDKEISYFFEKERNFTEEDIVKMVEKQRWICGQLVKKLKQLQDENKIEITFTPFYHPILPILCDPEKAKISNPTISLPQNYLSLKEDAQAHIKLGKQYYENLFGVMPKGVWPAEGSVSEDVVNLFSNNGIMWFATDEEVLMRTLYLCNMSTEHHKVYKHYQFKIANSSIYGIFRDTEISNNIGFVYYRWNYKDAVKDVELKLKSIYENVYNRLKYDTAIVSIILDGENCWEFYPNDGTEFLNEFYQMLTTNGLFETVLISDYISKNPNTEVLTKLWPGSWIGANFNIWIGHPEDNLAWEYLYKTRNFLVNYLSKNKNTLPQQKIDLCWQEIYTAEGSDWFWWFGDEHYTPQSYIFDFLFRQHLKNVYIILGEQTPSYLDIPIKSTSNKIEYVAPSNFISPKIDGRVSNYFEWIFAGKYTPISSAMHHTSNILKSFYFGFDLENLYFRLDYNEIGENNLIVCLYLLVNDKKNCQLKFNLEKYNKEYTFIKNVAQQKFENLHIDKVIELKLPLVLLDSVAGDEIKFFVTVEKIIEGKLNDIQRLPEDGFITIIHPDSTYFKKFFIV